MNSKILNDLPTVQNMRSFRDRITHWFESNERDYPWRKTNDPFKVLIAEIMLRRTKAEQVKKVYLNLFTQYPDIKSIAEAEEEELQRILYPLGLRWRNPAFQAIAREIKENYRSRVPDTREQLATLPGVGDYVAGAVLSIGYGKAEWIVDSNIVRMFRRYFGVETSREGRRDSHIIEMAKTYVSVGDPRRTNLALLDFSAIVCTPRNPNCENCPLRINCQFYLQYHANDIH